MLTIEEVVKLIYYLTDRAFLKYATCKNDSDFYNKSSSIDKENYK